MVIHQIHLKVSWILLNKLQIKYSEKIENGDIELEKLMGFIQILIFQECQIS